MQLKLLWDTTTDEVEDIKLRKIDNTKYWWGFETIREKYKMV